MDSVRGGNINIGHMECEFSFPADSILPKVTSPFSRRVRSPYSTKREKKINQNLDVTGVAMVPYELEAPGATVPNVSSCRDEHLLLVHSQEQSDKRVRSWRGRGPRGRSRKCQTHARCKEIPVEDSTYCARSSEMISDSVELM